MKRVVSLFLIYANIFILGYLGLGISLHYSTASVRILPKFIEHTLDNQWGVQALESDATFLKYNLVHPSNHDTTETIVFNDDYASGFGILCFRGNAQRNKPTKGILEQAPKKVEIDWVFETDMDNRTTRLGTWGGGSGWTGQALVVDWPLHLKNKLYQVDSRFVQSKNNKEVIIGSLCGQIYFLDFLTGKPTRPALSIENPIKGTVSIDPRLNGLLYVGQGIPNGTRFGSYVFNMFTGKEVIYRAGLDSDAYRNWGAFDSNSLIDPVSGYWFHPAENGLIYKTKVTATGKVKNPLKFKYAGPNKSQGLEASFGAWNNLGFFGDNGGNVFCLNLMTMRPIWYFNKTNSGGMLASALPGKKRASNLVFAIFSRVYPSNAGMFVALNKKTGKLVYQIEMDHYSWASPIDLYDKHGNCYVFFTDVFGTIYLIDAQNGKLIQKKKMDCIWESSPIAWGNRIVLGARGNRIFSFLLH